MVIESNGSLYSRWIEGGRYCGHSSISLNRRQANNSLVLLSTIPEPVQCTGVRGKLMGVKRHRGPASLLTSEIDNRNVDYMRFCYLVPCANYLHISVCGVRKKTANLVYIGHMKLAQRRCVCNIEYLTLTFNLCPQKWNQIQNFICSIPVVKVWSMYTFTQREENMYTSTGV